LYFEFCSMNRYHGFYCCCSVRSRPGATYSQHIIRRDFDFPFPCPPLVIKPKCIHAGNKHCQFRYFVVALVIYSLFINRRKKKKILATCFCCIFGINALIYGVLTNYSDSLRGNSFCIQIYPYI
jgi:hypothetical protein